ncbi:hypothetical protein AB0C33_42805 [Nonomuraea sp. NPDC048881]|uniref:hypothetical protein n=1 Tax=Nonomuraea sp. NPDC048881 TaxID=3155030 RepID=UPI0033E32FED
MPQHTPRLVMYYRTHCDGGLYVSPLPLIERRTGLTHLVVATVEVGADGDVRLNGAPPDCPDLAQMWDDVQVTQVYGARALAMIDGLDRLDHDFGACYPPLRRLLARRRLDGVDLRLTAPMSPPGLARLIDRLRADFGPAFLIALTPSAAVDHDQVFRDRGADLAWLNLPMYGGPRSLADPCDYDAVLAGGVVPAGRLVAGAVTTPDNGGGGYVEIDRLAATVAELLHRHPGMGGVSGWEYYNALPGGTDAPWQWAERVGAALKLTRKP